MKISVEIQMKIKVDLLYNSAEILLDTDPEDFITHEKYPAILVAAIFTIAMKWNQIRCLSATE